MSLIRENGRNSRIHNFCVRVITSGTIPRHVAIIMDGNRRFAQKNKFDRSKGHSLGFEKLSEVLECCLDLGITEVTVYAFSIENFKRSKEEVDGLMELAREKFAALMAEKELIEKHGIRFRVLGDWSLLPLDIQQLIAEGVNMTKDNSRAILNVCFSYTSQDEMCHAMKDIAEGVSLGIIHESDITERLFEECLYTGKSKPPDLLIRTSGEIRLSDFLLWQSSYSVLSFIKVLWPEFSRWHLYAAVLHHQRHHDAIQKAREENELRVDQLQEKADVEYLREEELKRRNLENSSRDDDDDVNRDNDDVNRDDDDVNRDNDDVIAARRLERFRSERRDRIGKFLVYLEEKQNEQIEMLLKLKPRQTSLSPATSCNKTV